MDGNNFEVKKYQEKIVPKEFQSKARGKPKILKQDTYYEIKYFLYTVFNIIIFLSLVSNNFGILGKVSIYFLKGGFGFFAYEIPLILIVLNIYFLIDKENKIKFPTNIFISTIVVLVLLMQLIGIDCGLVGKFSLNIVTTLLGETGAYILLVALLLILIILLLDISAVGILFKKPNSINKIESNKQTLDVFSESKKIYSDYTFPSLNLLLVNKSEINNKEVKISEANALKIENLFRNFSVDAKVVSIKNSPNITKYEILPNQGTKTIEITSLAKEISRILEVKNIRIEETSKGKGTIGIEVPNENLKQVLLRELIETEKFQKAKSKTIFALGIDISGNTIIVDIYDMPHLLISGSTGSGKSVCINTLITSILYKATPDEVKLVLIDPKLVEMSRYNGIPHLLFPVITDVKKGIAVLENLVDEMEKRYQLFDKKGVTEIREYNKISSKKLATIVVIIDELNDFMMTSKKGTEENICRLTQKSRATGILIVVATQRPSKDVITGVIKSNIPSRIAFYVPSQIDSRIILDEVGAEKLQGKGDMLFKQMGKDTIRIQGSLIKKDETDKIVKHLKTQYNIKYDDEVFREGVIEKLLNENNVASKQNNEIYNFDEEKTIEESENYFDEKIIKESKNCFIEKFKSTSNIVDVIDYIVKEGRASASMIQKEFAMGYNKASKIILELERENIIPVLIDKKCNKPRDVLLTMEQWQEIKLRSST